MRRNKGLNEMTINDAAKNKQLIVPLFFSLMVLNGPAFTQDCMDGAFLPSDDTRIKINEYVETSTHFSGCRQIETNGSSDDATCDGRLVRRNSDYALLGTGIDNIAKEESSKLFAAYLEVMEKRIKKAIQIKRALRSDNSDTPGIEVVFVDKDKAHNEFSDEFETAFRASASALGYVATEYDERLFKEFIKKEGGACTFLNYADRNYVIHYSQIFIDSKAGDVEIGNCLVLGMFASFGLDSLAIFPSESRDLKEIDQRFIKLNAMLRVQYSDLVAPGMSTEDVKKAVTDSFLACSP